MRKSLGLFLLFLVVLTVVACARPAVRAPRSPAPQAPDFDAETVDVSIDWQSTPSEPSLDRADVKLTASDGSGLRLSTVQARAVLYGPLAFTELHFVFANPEPRTREGTFAITLPDGAAVTRFAMRLGNAWQEGEVVEKQAARATYEAYVHRKVDPALLERDSGNVFRGRVFPIFGGENKEIVVSYTQTLAGESEPYRLPLVGLPQLDLLDVQLLVPGRKKAFVLHRNAWTPDRDFVHRPEPGSASAVRGGRWAVARVSATAPNASPPSPIGSVAVLVDSSASRAGALARDVDRARRLVEALKPAAVKIACFDQEVVPVGSFAEAAAVRAAGASNLARGLEWLRTSGASRAIVVTDGAATIGPRGAALAAEVAKLRGAGIHRLDALRVGGAKADGRTLEMLVASGLEEDGAVVDAELGTDRAAHALRAPAKALRSVELPGAIRTWPASLARGAGAEALAFVEIAEDRPLLVATNGGPPRAIERVEVAPAPLVERAVAEAKIRELDIARWDPKASAEERKRIEREIVALSVRHRVLTDLTAMLVLESEYDYARFDIPRDAAQNIPVVGPRGVEIVSSSRVLPPRPSNVSPLLDAKQREDEALDSDGDRIPDVDDKCPNEPETYNGIQDADGCPDRGHVLIEKQSIHILQQIHFPPGSAAIPKEAAPVLDELAEALRHHPEIELVGVFGHADDPGDAAANEALSKRRALAVKAALVARGIDERRLVAHGVGKTDPLDPSRTPEARAKNRRVGFVVLFHDGMPTEATLPRGLKDWMPEPLRNKPWARRAPLTGRLADIVRLLDQKKASEALDAADAWTKSAPDDMLAWIALGRALDAMNRTREAARAYGSIIDLAGRPEHLRAAGGWLEALSRRHPPALDVAIEAYRRALDERPDHPSSHRLYAWSLARAGRLEEAFDVALAARGQTFSDRFPGANDLFASDVALLASALARGREGEAKEAVLRRAAGAGAPARHEPSTSVVLTWESDESDLDLLVYDTKGELSGAAADIRTGYGPESLSLAGRPELRVEVERMSTGPTELAFGKVSIVRHDGRGTLAFDDRPFVSMRPFSVTDLGTVR